MVETNICEPCAFIRRRVAAPAIPCHARATRLDPAEASRWPSWPRGRRLPFCRQAWRRSGSGHAHSQHGWLGRRGGVDL